MKIINLNDPVCRLEIDSEIEKMRVAEILKQHGIETVGQLCRLTELFLRHILLFGDLTVISIELALEKEGLQLGMTEAELLRYNRLENHFQQQYEEIAERESKDSDFLRRFKECKAFLNLAGNDYEDEGCDDIHEQENYEKEDSDKDIAFIFHNDIHMPKSEPKHIDWDERFYEIAKEEFLRQGRSFTTDETRAERAIMAADTFMESLKLFYEKGKKENGKTEKEKTEEGKKAEKNQEPRFHR